jgi:serine/threonine-protein kinase
MITREGVLKLTDFGIAKDIDVTALTRANSLIGTTAYMSPEQCKGDRNLSNKSDLYSLGVVLFELVSGRKPFSADTVMDMLFKHVNETPPRIGALVDELPPKFEWLILQLLEKETDDRPVDAKWVARMLGEIEDDAVARKRAGLAAAQVRTAKPLDPSGDKMDAADKQAARAGRGKKTRIKKKATGPFLQQKWVQAVGILAVLALIALGAYVAIRPASAEKMFAAIEKADTLDAKGEAAARFLEAHGETGGERVDQAAAIFRAAKVRERERQLVKRLPSNNPGETDDPEAYGFAHQAVTAERSGQFDLAEAMWGKVKGRFPEEAHLPYTTTDEQLAKARWGWLADKRIQDVKAARAELAKLEQKISDNKQHERAAKYDPADPESVALRAIRLRGFGDMDRALRTCEALIGQTEKDSDKRAWYLLGCYIKAHLTNGPLDPISARNEHIEEWLTEAENKAKVVKDDPDNTVERWMVRNNCREVIELYEDDPEITVKDAIKRAKAIAAMVPKN